MRGPSCGTGLPRESSFPLRGWIQQSSQEDAGYATAFAMIALLVPEGRLSIANREPPRLPKECD